MIKIHLENKNGKTEVDVKAQGSGEELTNEIYIILDTLSSHVPELFDAAVEKHLNDLREEESK